MLKEKYNLELVKQKKEDLEGKLATGYSSGANMSSLSMDLSYYSTLFAQITELYKNIDNWQQANSILSSETNGDLIAMAKNDIETSQKRVGEIEKEIMDIEIKRKFSDPDDNKSVILEIRAGAGGQEASLFASELYRMYSMFGNSKGWKFEVIDSSVGEGGGFKEIIAHVIGKNVFKLLKYESGVHRVQRVPVTESSGRIHTSTASIAIMPEAAEIDVKINPEDIKLEVMRAGGAGGQCVNRTDSAVRITHIPTGIVVSCQETKHQDQNKVKAMNLLRARLYDKMKQEADAARSKDRKDKIGMAMRAEKIRTYNFPQNRVTDHRVKVSWFNIEGIMNGNIENMILEITDCIQKGNISVGEDIDE
ncbi:peptide chain release factor 1 [Candidatus Dojkabacteria bacterium]|nr:peptide chain release factor 1 [Candidatus Dojkabacteria bacterium]